MVTSACFLVFGTSLAKEAAPQTKIRSNDGYSVSIELSAGEISSITMKHGKVEYLIPKELHTDIKKPHLTKGFKADDFTLEVTGNKAIVRIKSGDPAHIADHAWIMSLPLKSVSRITRRPEVTGFHEAHPATALEHLKK